ncbi:MAG: helix-turn-helix transcriptional regulator [bacterium]|nr:helix-turn-helix transcriptional regulator [bacterium]MDT8367028.1 helix-turn-helix transcriptional regulator [bacterium]
MAGKREVSERRFGEFFKAKRMDLGKTLRTFAMENGLDPGNLSKLERGVLSPPQKGGKLEEYAALLNLKEGTDDWYTFFDLAAAESGRIPDDILSDQRTLERLPLFFRSIRGNKITDEQFHKLIELIKKS